MRKIILLSMLTQLFCFKTGTMTVGGIAGMNIDLDEEIKTIYIMPDVGYFIQPNLLTEWGVNWIKYLDSDYDPDMTFNIGVRYFLPSTTGGRPYIGYAIDSWGDYNEIHMKIGLLYPIATNVYIDSVIDYNWTDFDTDVDLKFGIAYFLY